MIVTVSCALGAYELVAIRSHCLPTVTELSARWPWGLLVYGWLIWLAVHFLRQRRSHGSLGH